MTRSSRPAPGPRPRWRSWLLRSLVVVLVLLVLARASLGLWLPPLLSGLAEDQGYSCSFESLELSLSTVEWKLSHLQLDPLQGRGPSLHVEFADADVSVWHLLFGELVVPRIEVDGLDLQLVRNALGEIELPGSPGGAAGEADLGDDDASEAAVENAGADGESDEIPSSLLAPLRLDALRLQHAQVHWRDETVDPPLTTRVDVDLRVSDLGSDERPVRGSLTVAASDLLDRLHLEVSGSSSETDARATLLLRLGGLDLSSCAELLAPLGLSQVAGPFHCDLVGDVSLSTDPSRPALELSLRDLSLGNGGDGDISLRQLSLLIPRWSRDLTLADVTVEGLSARADRQADGALHVAGLRWIPTAGQSSTETEDEPAEPGSGGLIIQHLRLAEHSLSWSDEGVVPAAELTLRLEELTLDDLSLGTALTSPARLQGRFSAPGVFESLTLIGSVQPLQKGGRVRLDVGLAGLAPHGLQGYLAAASVSHSMVNGRVDVGLQGGWRREPDGSLHAQGGLTTLTLQAAGEELSLGAVTLAGLVVSPDGAAIDIEAIELSGLEATLSWDEQGVLHLPGLAVGVPGGASAEGASSAVSQPAPDSAGAATTDAVADAGVPAASVTAPNASGSTRLTLQRFLLDAQQLTLAPAGREPLNFDHLALTVEQFELAEGPPTLQHFDLRMALADVVGDFHLGGEVSRAGPASVVDLELLATGLQGALLASLLSDKGARPSLHDGELSLSLRLETETSSEGLQVSLSLDELKLIDQGRKVLGVERLSVDELLVAGSDISIGEVFIDGPFLRVSRTVDGELQLPGLLLPQADPGDDEARVAGPAAVLASPSPSPDDPAAPAPQFRLDHLALRGGALEFDDAGLGEPLSTVLAIDMDVQGLELGDDPPPTQLSLTLSLPGSQEQLALEGQLIAAPESLRADLTLRGRGLTLAGVAPYLAPLVRPALADGRLDLRLQAAVVPNELGGQGLSLALSDFAYFDGSEDSPLLAWDELSFSAARVDPASRVFEIESLRWQGITGAAARDEQGALHVAGLIISPAPAAAEVREADEGVAPSEVADVVEAVEAAGALEDLGEMSHDMAAIAAAGAVKALPTWLRFEQFELGVERFDWLDAGRDPLSLRDLSLFNTGPIVLEEDTSSGPFELALLGSLPPLLDEFGVKATLDPFAVEPQVSIDVVLQGLDGPALARLAPELIDGEGLSDGHFAAHLEAAWLGRRRSPLDFSLRNGVPLEVSLSDMAYRDRPDGEVLLGLSELRAEIDDGLGESGDMLLRSLEIVEPVVRIERNERGLQLGHLLFLTPPADPVDEAVADAAAAVGPEIAVKSLLMTGIDVVFKDLTSDPPLVLPLIGLDVDVSGVSTRALTEPLPLVASIFLRGGVPDVELVPGREPRKIFDEISVNGRWTLFPQLTGDTRVQLDALDLVAFRGPAAASDVIIDDGVLDARIDLKFEDDGDLNTDARFLFGDLDIDEPAGGPISSFLKLPSALGGVLFVLQDEDGVIDIPLSVDVAAEGLSVTEVTQVAVTTLGVLVATAIANTPFRVVGGLTDGVGSLMGLADDEAEPGEPVEVLFGAGELWLSSAALSLLGALRERVLEEDGLIVTLRHEMGVDDQLLLAERANPPIRWTEEMAARLRVHKALLIEERSLIAERLGAELTSGLTLAAQSSTHELGELDERLGLAEQGLDELLELLRPGNERLAGRRTRTMCLSIAALRLDRLAAALRQALPPTEYDRVRVLAPRWESDPERVAASIVMTPALRKGE